MSLAPARPPSAAPLLIPQPYRVVEKVAETADITTLHVVPVDGPLPSFEPAQFSMVGAFGVGEAALSISSSVTNTGYHAYTIRRAGPITGALVDTPIGGVVTVRGPFGRPWPLPAVAGGQVLIVGGGCGIAPLRALIDASADAADRFDGVALAYGAKEPDQLVFRTDLARWRQEGVEVALVVDEGDPGWTGAVGMVPDLFGANDGLQLDWTDTTAFVCGPDVMMRVVAAALTELGVAPDRIWLTLERNMQCGNALCGHCQLGPFIVCRDGPVVGYDEIARFLSVENL